MHTELTSVPPHTSNGSSFSPFEFSYWILIQWIFDKKWRNSPLTVEMRQGGGLYYFQDMYFSLQIWKKTFPLQAWVGTDDTNVPFTLVCSKFQGLFVLSHLTTLTVVAWCHTLTSKAQVTCLQNCSNDQAWELCPLHPWHGAWPPDTQTGRGL